jgi:hypothetical protein
MTLRNSSPSTWSPVGLTDSYDDMGFSGSMLSLQNLIPDPGTPAVWQCRPAAQKVSSFPGFTAPGFISCMLSVGNLLVGMIATSRNAGNDEPFVYNTVTGLFAAVSGVTAANTPASPATTGAWTPPCMTLVGGTVIIAHQGFNAASGYYIGVLNVSNPAAPTWTAGTLTGAVAFPAKPTAVAQFNGRCWYAVGNAVIFSDTTNPTNCTNGNQVITFGTNQSITALVGMPLISTQLGGVIQSLIVFIGTITMYQISGDAASTTSPLNTNNLNIATGTYNQNSVCPTPQGLAFVSPEGIRFVNSQAQVSDPIGAYGQGLARVFYYVSVPSRVVMQYATDTIRVSLQNGLAAGAPNQEYFYHLTGKRWSGPHTFPASLIQPVGASFFLAPVGVTGSLWQSNAVPGLTNTYTENGSPLQWAISTPLLPDSKDMCEHAVVEQTIKLALNAMDQYLFSFVNEQGAILGSTIVAGQGSSTVWGAFNWGSALWGGVQQSFADQQLSYAQPIVFKRSFFVGSGPSSAAFRLGGISTRVEDLGYLLGSTVPQVVQTTVLKGSFTLVPNATTTTVLLPACLPTSVITAIAATEDARENPISIVPGTGKFVVTHGANPAADQTFNYTATI